MNIKDFLLRLGHISVATFITFIGFWLFQHFFFGRQQVQPDSALKAGQHFVASRAAQAAKPLNTEIDFIDMKRPASAIRTEIETENARYVFSTDGASLERMEVKRQAGKEWISIDTIFPPNEYEKEQRCFLVALNEKTPYYYQLIDHKESDCDVVLIYRTDFGDCSIEKRFIVFKHSYQFDVEIRLIPKKGIVQSFEPRIFYISPRMPELQDDIIDALVRNERGAIEKKPLSSLDPRDGWFSPTLFGSDNKYFIHAIINDPDNFVRRAYYNIVDQYKLISIIEGPPVSQETTTWKLSFYVGPKELKAMADVDTTLEQTLDYTTGWRWLDTIVIPIAKFMLALLIFLYGYLGNYGFAIIILTILMRLLLLPFTIKGESERKKQEEFQKKLAYLRQKYKHDRQRLAQEQAELVKKHGMPGMASCLPLLLQLPIFYVLSRILSSSIELYKAPFTLWITDLSARDPYYVLPILITATMLLQPQPTTGDIKSRLPLIGFGLFIGALSTTFSAGVSLYIFCSMALNIAQIAIQRMFKR